MVETFFRFAGGGGEDDVLGWGSRGNDVMWCHWALGYGCAHLDGMLFLSDPMNLDHI